MAAAKNLLAPAGFVAGLATACAGISLVYLPAGLIAAGTLTMLLSVGYVRGAPPKAAPDA